jgi:hypothetical protein
MRIALFIAILALLTGCARQSVSRVAASRPLTPEEARITEIARHAVGKRHKSQHGIEHCRRRGDESILARYHARKGNEAECVKQHL